MTDIGAALGKIPSGIFIVTARHDGQSTGMLGSWVMQAAFEPPMVTVAVRKDRYLAEWLQDKAAVAVNILSDDEKNMISHYGRGFEPGADAFEGIELRDDEPDVPVIADALAYLVGNVEGSLETGDHIVFSLRIVRGRLMREAAPMIHVRKDGMRY